MKQPAFQFYIGDWRKDPALQACSFVAKGILMETICLMFECAFRGALITGASPWSLSEWICAVGGNPDIARRGIRELVDNGVIRVRGGEPSEFIDKNADILQGIPEGAFYSLRLVRDENRRDKTRDRVQRHRVRTCNAQVTCAVTRLKHASSSSTSSSDKEVLQGVSDSDVTQFKLRIGKLFGRRPETPWNKVDRTRLNEVMAMKPTEEDIALIEAYYTPRHQQYRRGDIATLLHNWSGEVDRARAEKETGRKAAPNGNTPPWRTVQNLEEEVATLANRLQIDCYRTPENIALLKSKRAQLAQAKGAL